MATPETAIGKSSTVTFDGALCIHARRCVMAEPGVYQANVEGPWIDPDAASADAVMATAINCPSGAIHVTRTDGGPQEPKPKVNTVTIREHGPLALYAEIALNGAPIGYRATLCRCGASNNKPYCDGSHSAAGFVSTGEPPAKESQPLAVRDGPVKLTPYPNGPLGVAGPVEILTGTGHTIDRAVRVALCRCGHSENKPYCDGTHSKIGFVAP